ncbi:methyl-accepting chemotaxis protein [Litoribrevibacter euphylliae]|uniref:Methyl-accepting chemotaxis protein n=1 Tax=Litoribrevibacter euphylliae TaxID=1834034 RepID=A0ABV7HBS1_9GAMM
MTLSLPSSLNNLPVAVKLSMFTVMLGIPITILLIFLINSENYRIKFSEKEMVGNAYIVYTYPLQESFAKHRGMMAAYLNGDKSFDSKITQIEKQANQQLLELTAIAEETEQTIPTKQKLDEIKSHWSKLDGQRSLPPVTSFKEHTALIAKVLELITYVADHSNLTLDPDLDTFYLMDLTTNTLPNLMEILGRTRGLASGIATSQTLSMDEMLILSVNLDKIETLVKKAESSLKTSIDNSVHPTISNELTPKYQSLISQIDHFIALVQTELLSNPKAISVAGRDIFQSGTTAIVATKQLLDSSTPMLSELIQTRIDNVTSSLYRDLGIVASICVISLLFVHMITKNIKLQTQHILKSISAVTQERKLTETSKVLSKDELGIIAENFNQMLVTFKGIVDQINSSSMELAAVAEQTATTSEQSTVSLTEQQHETSQLATAIHEMATTAEEVANSTVRASEAAGNVDSQANEGNSLVNEAVYSIETLNQEVLRVEDVLTKLKASSENITGVLDVIKSVAEQTNLLALNAAIEAARAGEQGRGFSVVADEVRALAQRTYESVGEIESILMTFQNHSEEAYSAIGASKVQVQESNDKVKAVEKALVQIGIAISTIRDMNHQIACASEEYTSVNQEINRNVIRIDEMSQETVTGASEISDASKKQATLVHELKTLACSFSV